MRIAAHKAYCRICRTALLTRKSLIPMRTSAKSVPRKKRTAATTVKTAVWNFSKRLEVKLLYTHFFTSLIGPFDTGARA